MSELIGTDPTGVTGDPEPRSEGSGLRSQLEASLAREAELKKQLETGITEAEQRGAQRAQRRFEVSGIVGQDRPGLVDAFVEKNPEWDGSKDAVVEFAKGFGVDLTASEPAPEPTVAPEVVEAAKQFNVTPQGVVTGANKTYTPEEIRQIGLQNEAEALRIIADGGLAQP